MATHIIINPQNNFVMNALEERKKKHLYTASKNIKLLVNQPPKELFKVVVNNYGKKEMSLNKEEENVETMSMPPQPSGYIKYPNYDWY
jgi:intracellular sulfur oxidation DsrE/DsrF family protein